jgi:diketogulonate reductase-like aldo/keto reductase
MDRSRPSSKPAPQQRIATTALPDGFAAPTLGQGTWRMGERRSTAPDEVAAIALGLDLGMTLVDTAEMYGDGGAEEIVGRAIASRRDEVTVVTKVYPHNAGRNSAIAACERSLRRLRTDRVDLYLLHWPGRIPLTETVDAFERLRAAGKSGGACRISSRTYRRSRRCLRTLRDQPGPLSPGRRGVGSFAGCANDGCPRWRTHHWGRVHCAKSQTRGDCARLHATPAQSGARVALAGERRDLIPRPRREHVRSNRAAADLVLDAEARSALDAAFPPPRGSSPLSVL